MRLRRICSDDEDFKQRSIEYHKYLTDCGHDSEHVLKVFNEIGGMTRQQARTSKRKNEGRPCAFISKFNPWVPDICKIICKQRSIIDNDERAKQGRSYNICKSLTCTLQNVVYIAHCVACDLQAVGSTANFKSRLANYKSHIKHKKRTCGIANHFIDSHGGDHSAHKFMLIDQHHGNVRQRENFWIGTLITNLRGLNNSHDFVQQ